MIEITPAAVREIKRLQSSRHKQDSYLYIGVKDGGCCGLFYYLDLKAASPTDSALEENNNYFFYNNNGLSIIIEEANYLLINSLNLDYSEDLMGGGFRFHNPHAVTTCSCGQSFAISGKS